MAIAATSIGSAGTTLALSAYSCQPVSVPGTTNLVLVGVVVSDNANTPVEPTSVVGAGLTFSMVTSSVTYAPSSLNYNISAWRAMGAADNSLVTATFPNSATGCAMNVCEISGLATGSNGANAIGQSATSLSDASVGCRVYGPSALSTANAWLSFHGVSNAGNVDGATPTGFTRLESGITYDAPTVRLASAWTTLSTGTSLLWTHVSNQNHGAVHIELVAQAPNVLPTAAFSSVVNGLSVQFTDESTDSDGTINQWDWDFGDGSAHGTTQHPNHTYASATTFTVTLTVTDDRLGTGNIPHDVITQTPTEATSQFGQSMQGRSLRVFPPRVRGDSWAEPGHAENSDPATDTREG